MAGWRRWLGGEVGRRHRDVASATMPGTAIPTREEGHGRLAQEDRQGGSMRLQELCPVASLVGMIKAGVGWKEEYKERALRSLNPEW